MGTSGGPPSSPGRLARAADETLGARRFFFFLLTCHVTHNSSDPLFSPLFSLFLVFGLAAISVGFVSSTRGSHFFSDFSSVQNSNDAELFDSCWAGRCCF